MHFHGCVHKTEKNQHKFNFRIAETDLLSCAKGHDDEARNVNITATCMQFQVHDWQQQLS
jgi:hypothetical protein